MEEGHEGLTQFLMNEVTKLQQQSKVKTLQHAELNKKFVTLEDEKRKLKLANQELQAFQQSKDSLFLFEIFPDRSLLASHHLCFYTEFVLIRLTMQLRGCTKVLFASTRMFAPRLTCCIENITASEFDPSPV